jgi:hypothetical protein
MTSPELMINKWPDFDIQLQGSLDAPAFCPSGSTKKSDSIFGTDLVSVVLMGRLS